jgi:hypothetical protein
VLIQLILCVLDKFWREILKDIPLLKDIPDKLLWEKKSGLHRSLNFIFEIECRAAARARSRERDGAAPLRAAFRHDDDAAAGGGC